MRRWTSLAAFLPLLLLAGAADGLMDALGLFGFAVVPLTVLGAAGVLVEVTDAGGVRRLIDKDGWGLPPWMGRSDKELIHGK